MASFSGEVLRSNVIKAAQDTDPDHLIQHISHKIERLAAHGWDSLIWAYTPRPFTASKQIKAILLGHFHQQGYLVRYIYTFSGQPDTIMISWGPGSAAAAAQSLKRLHDTFITLVEDEILDRSIRGCKSLTFIAGSYEPPPGIFYKKPGEWSLQWISEDFGARFVKHFSEAGLMVGPGPCIAWM